MQLRETLLNLAITCVLVLIVVLVAILLRESRVPSAIPVKRAGVPLGSGATLAEDGYKVVEANFIAFPGAEFIESNSNEPDAFRVKIGAEEFVFVLYFVDALEASWTHPQLIAAQAKWFGNIQHQAIVDGGQVAMQYVSSVLKAKPFTVYTRWERVPNSSRYYALIGVDEVKGRRTYLTDLLMAKGYARVGSIMTFMPPGDPRSEVDYGLELKNIGTKARAQKVGIWAAGK